MKLSYSTTVKKINLFALLFFVFWLPLKDNFLPAILSFWLFTWLLEGNFKNRFNKFSNKLIYIIISTYFLLTVLSLLYTNDIDVGLFEIQKKLSMLFFPIIIIGSNKKVKNNYNTILYTFVIGNLIASIYLLSNAFFSNLIIENGTWFIEYCPDKSFKSHSFFELINLRFNNFSASYLSIFIHPSYFAMFLVFSIVILIYFFKQNFIKKTTLKLLTISIILLFVFMIYLLQSRASFITFFVVIVFLILYEIKKHNNKKLIISGIFVISVSVTFILSSSAFQEGFNKLNKILSNKNKLEIVKKDARFQTWYSAKEVIKENFWFGTSPPDVYKELTNIYIKYNFPVKEKELNAHNQYLESFAGLGVFGFISLMSILICGFIYAYNKKHYLLFFLLLISSINFLFESMLNRMAGILFMMFFYSLFVFGDKQSKTA